MADLDQPQNIPLWISGALAILAGVVTAVERLTKVRLDWRGRPMPERRHHIDAPDSVPPPSDLAPVTRRGRGSLTTLSEQIPPTRAEFEARFAALEDRVANVERSVVKLDDEAEALKIEVVRGVGGINTRIARLRERIASVVQMYDGPRRGGR
jgi:hypothetical protein